MKTALSLIVVFGLIAVTFGQLKDEVNTGPPGECNPKTFLVGRMKQGEQKQVPGMCVLVKCNADKVEYETCRPILGSQLPMNTKYQFPRCCPLRVALP